MPATVPIFPLTERSNAMPQLSIISVAAGHAVLYLVRPPRLFNYILFSDSCPGIRNPISLAKLILDSSNKPLSLRRVPPNALVGEGARTFAQEHGMATYANERLVSRNARDRFLRWQEDLKRAEDKAKDPKPRSATNQSVVERRPGKADPASPTSASAPAAGDHVAAIIAGTWNEGQPDSPAHETPRSEEVVTYFKNAVPSAATTAQSAIQALPEPATNNDKAYKDNGNTSSKDSGSTKRQASMQSDSVPNGYSSQSSFETVTPSSGVKRPLSPVDDDEGRNRPSKKYGLPFLTHAEGDDVITDTVGAIAIDNKGHIAAGSSSGGIGMKHRGRLGPAALVGIGTAVVPCAPDDEEGVTVAAVTSGTGEHMATTMASQRCAERVHRGTRKGSNGSDVADDDENVIMESFIAHDFMSHAGVKHCHSTGAIGVMVVKKARTGYYFYFAHNTDSFALASMGGSDKKPVCTMSRLPKGADIAKGGRKIRLD